MGFLGEKTLKTAILYASSYLQKTKRLVENIGAKISDVTLIDVTKLSEQDLSDYDLIGMSYGLYNGKSTNALVAFIENNLPEKKNFFFMYNCGSEAPKNLQKITECVLEKNPNVIGAFDCFISKNPYGPLQQKEITRAVQFVEALA